MEPGEEITEAAIREVKEETGLDFEPSTLLSVEAAGTCFLPHHICPAGKLVIIYFTHSI